MSQRNGCWHCGEALPQTATLFASIAGEQRALCCPGCVAAAQWIEQLGLSDYYRLRTHNALKPDVDEGEQATLWARPAMARHVVRDLPNDRREVLLAVEGIRCSACVWLIERALGRLPGVVEVHINASAARARIVWDAQRGALDRILHTFSRIGYRAVPLEAGALDDVRQRESRAMLKRLLVAGFGAMQAMMYASSLYLGVIESGDAITRDLMRWLGLLVATPVVFYSAQPFFAGAWRSLRGRRLGMDVPVALAISLIYSASVAEAFRGGVEVYFDSVSMFVFFLLIGRALEMSARHRAGHLSDALARLQPPFADRVMADGQIERIGIHEVQNGDCLRVLDGAYLPADGVLESPQVQVDENLMTGESRPQTRRAGDTLLAGTVLIQGPAQLRVTGSGSATALSGVIALAVRAQTERPQLAQAGERAAARFVLRVLSIALLTAIIWAWIDPSRAFAATVAVLVVSCPCAFALAVPAAMTRALALLAQHGVLVTRPDALVALAQASHVLFDKTGTLTEPTLATSAPIKDPIQHATALTMAAALAQHSQHPVARAVVAASADRLAAGHVENWHADQVETLPGQGLRGRVNGRHLRLGRDPDGRDDGALLLSDGQTLLARFVQSDELRDDAITTLDALRRQGLKIEILSGDASGRVQRVADQLGVNHWRARQQPADKLARLSQLQADGACVVMVGDGINDAPVLAGANVGVALASGSALAQTRSDIVMTGTSLMPLLHARRLAQRAMQVLQQNQRWALGYNLAMIPPAALGWVPPWLAALGMSLSSVVVILNALRMSWPAPATPTPPHPAAVAQAAT